MLTYVYWIAFLPLLASAGILLFGKESPQSKLPDLSTSMLGLVMTSILFIFFSCWELMGLSSYLLIGFWFEKPGPAFASKKAFITTKMGDLCLYLGLLLLFAKTGTFDLVMLKERAVMGG